MSLALRRRFVFDSASGAIVHGRLHGVEHVYSQTRDDAVMVTARFLVGTPADAAILRVHDKLLAPAGGLVRAESKQRTHRVYDARGRDLTPDGIDFIGIPSDGMVRVWKGREQGFMTVDGRLAVPPRFGGATDFKDGRARVWIDGKFGYIDKTGQLVVPAIYESAEDYSEQLALVKQGGRSLYIDLQGRVVLEPKADRAWPFSGGYAVVKVGTLHGYIDRQGRTVIEPRYTWARPFQNGLAYAGIGRESGYIRPDGQYVWRSSAP